MNKIKGIITALFIILSITIPAFAGSVPESLLRSKEAQVYFGEVKEVEGQHITVIMRQNIKGPFEQDEERSGKSFGFVQNPKIGTTYLCGYFDDSNHLYLWEVDSLDPKTLIIKPQEESYSMDQRMEKYLNEGQFEEEQQKLLALQEQEKSQSSKSQEDSQKPEDSLKKEVEEPSPSTNPPQGQKTFFQRQLLLWAAGVALLLKFLWQKIQRDARKK